MILFRIRNQYSKSAVYYNHEQLISCFTPFVYDTCGARNWPQVSVFLYNRFLLTLLIQRSMFLSADIIQINVLIQQNHQSSTVRFFLPLFVKEIETYEKKNRHLLVLYVFFHPYKCMNNNDALFLSFCHLQWRLEISVALHKVFIVNCIK